MTETYKAGEIEISVKLDTSALKGEFAALNQSLAKSGQEASKGFLDAFGAEFKASKDKYKSSVFEAVDFNEEAKKAGISGINACVFD